MSFGFALLQQDETPSSACPASTGSPAACFGGGLDVDVSLRSAKFFGAMLHVHTGYRREKIRCKPGVVQYCKDPRAKDAVTEDVGVLVVESRCD